MNFCDDSLLPYKVGGLLYTPAINAGITEKIKNGAFPCLTSLALCLEDAVRDNAVEQAENVLKNTLCELKALSHTAKIPLLFVRVRTPEHLRHIHEFLGDNEQILTGYILPKFDLSNACEYADIILKINEKSAERIYIMPIIESGAAADISRRTETLCGIKKILDSIKPFVLNVRVGGNDFSSLYGLRRNISQNIYEIGVIRDILVDIINVFASDYVVSGAVWEYFGEDSGGAWAEGLKRELELDRLNGFIGKTAVHPSQLPIIFESLTPTRADFEDARKILSWNDEQSGVAKSADGNRMNELKTHGKWAERIVRLAEIYGVKNDENLV